MTEHLAWCDSRFFFYNETPRPCNCGADAALVPPAPEEPSAASLMTGAAVDRLAKRCIEQRTTLKPGVVGRLRRWLTA